MNHQHEVQLSGSPSLPSTSTSTSTSVGMTGISRFSSYQQESSTLGPGMARIMEHQRQQEVNIPNEDDNSNDEPMRRKKRVSYAMLGAVLLGFYFFMWHKEPLKKNKKAAAAGSKKHEEYTSKAGDEFGDSMEDELVNLPLLGSSHHKKEKKEPENKCQDGNYSKRTLKRAYELPFASLFKDTKGQKKYEASSVYVVDDNVYAICDNSWSVYRFGDDLVPFQAGNQLIGDPTRETEDSGYEALFYDNGIFYVMRESVLHDATKTYHAVIEELDISTSGDDYTVTDTCSSEFEFEGDSKGFEGALSLHDTSNELIVLGLCEGNHCSEKNKFDIGHGEFVAMKKTKAPEGGCVWSTIRKIKIPSSASFRDYSAATMDEKGRVAISSQEDSAIWVGQLLGLDDTTGLWDLEKLEFDPKVGAIYDFPKNDNCETIYCNVEGIHWINEDMLIAVSDKMKSKGKQDFQCFEKDQSVHVFVLP